MSLFKSFIRLLTYFYSKKVLKRCELKYLTTLYFTYSMSFYKTSNDNNLKKLNILLTIIYFYLLRRLKSIIRELKLLLVRILYALK